MSDNWAEDISKDLGDLATDISRLIDNEKKKSEAKEGDVVKEKSPKSLQRLTTFYSSKEEAEEMSEEDPIIVFIDKRMKEIFEG